MFLKLGNLGILRIICIILEYGSTGEFSLDVLNYSLLRFTLDYVSIGYSREYDIEKSTMVVQPRLPARQGCDFES